METSVKNTYGKSDHLICSGRIPWTQTQNIVQDTTTVLHEHSASAGGTADGGVARCCYNKNTAIRTIELYNLFKTRDMQPYINHRRAIYMHCSRLQPFHQIQSYMSRSRTVWLVYLRSNFRTQSHSHLAVLAAHATVSRAANGRAAQLSPHATVQPM